MDFKQWEPVYARIIEEMGYSRTQDEASARLLRQLAANKELMDPDELRPLMADGVTVVGAAATPEGLQDADGTLICAGSAASIMRDADRTPHLLVTDLDGDVEDQAELCRRGSIAVIHAHGDNHQLIQDHIALFKGPMVITTQSRPDMLVENFGGFTDGDRAVCMARHMGAKTVSLIGFDFDRPLVREDEDEATKRRKIEWARRIILDMNPPGVKLVFR